MEESNQKMEEEGGEEKSFAELFEASEPDLGRLKPGQRVEAMIVKITPEWVFIDVGGKHEGHLDRKEFVDAEGNLTVKEGDTIRAYFLSSQHNEKLFTTKIGAGDAGRAFLEDAWKSGIPVEGVVEREVKGGFEVKVAGDTRGFCPFSQMGLFRIATPADWVGQRLAFKILEFGERGRNVVLSHRAILEGEQVKPEGSPQGVPPGGDAREGDCRIHPEVRRLCRSGRRAGPYPHLRDRLGARGGHLGKAEHRPGGRGGGSEAGLGERPDLPQPPIEPPRPLGAGREGIPRGVRPSPEPWPVSPNSAPS